MQGTTMIVVDYENIAQQWWDEARARRVDAPEALRSILDGETDQVVVTPSGAREVYEWAAQLPGWDEGLERAPHPLHWYVADEEDEDDEWAGRVFP